MCLLGLTTGLLIGRAPNSSPSPAPEATPAAFASADSGKLAKEYKEKVILKVIQENAKDIQKCYLDYLNLKEGITEGLIDILFKVEENGKISNLEITKNEFNNQAMGDCVAKKMSSYYLAPPPYGINRYISHTLAFKSEETAKKEAEERAKNNLPPKVLPVN